MDTKTIIDFSTNVDVWGVLEAWASENEYRLIGSKGSSDKLYQKGVGFLVAPMMLKVQEKDNQVHLEAWISMNLFVRIFSLFMLPSEMGIQSGGFRGIAPRKIARTAVNKLLERLNAQQAIK